jgi:hypothetical protein
MKAGSFMLYQNDFFNRQYSYYLKRGTRMNFNDVTIPEKELEDFLSQFEFFTYSEIEDAYCDFLDEIYEPVELAGMTVNASDMKDIDPIMFRCGCSDWSSEEFVEHGGDYYRKGDYQQAEDEFKDYQQYLKEEE